jgi:hypothetical protein
MKRPPYYSDREEDVAPFVTAADSGNLACACDLLFIHAVDLTWSGGLALVDHDLDPELKDDFAQKLRLIKTRVEHSIIPLGRWLMPTMEQAHVQFPGDSADMTEARVREAINSLGTYLSSSALTDQIGGLVIRNSQLVADGLADTVLTSGLAFRDRVIRGSGLSEDAYGEMIDSLRELRIIEGPLLRIAVPGGDSYPEISFAGPQGLRVTGTNEEAYWVDVYGLNAQLTQQKVGQDNALSLFIARYINQHSIAEEKVAYACAKYKGKSGSEFDVIVPDLECGLEVKLYESAWTLHSDSKIKARKDKLEEQLQGYTAAGVRKIYLVTNLQPTAATELLRTIDRSKFPNIAIDALCGAKALLAVLQQINKDLGQRIADKFKKGPPKK